VKGQEETEVVLTSNINRPAWDEYFMAVAFLVASRSTCLRRKVGAILVRDRRILATGYNGPPSGFPHCDEIGCLREKLKIPSGQRQELCWGIHAEQNAIIQAALFGVSTRDSKLYATTKPCITCAKILANAGVDEIYISEDYPDEFSDRIFSELNIKVSFIPKPNVHFLDYQESK
jgi:dCMP deaminase